MIRLGGRWKCTIFDEIFFHLASRPDLDTLQTTAHNITLSLIERMQKAVDHRFPDYLTCHVSRTAKLFVNSAAI